MDVNASPGDFLTVSIENLQNTDTAIFYNTSSFIEINYEQPINFNSTYTAMSIGNFYPGSVWLQVYSDDTLKKSTFKIIYSYQVADPIMITE